MTDSYNYGNINLGEAAGLVRAAISNGGAALGSTLAEVINFDGTPSTFGDIDLIQSPTDGTLSQIDQPGTYVISVTLNQNTGGPGSVAIAAGGTPPTFVSAIPLAGASIDDGLFANMSSVITILPSDINNSIDSIRNIRLLTNFAPQTFQPDGNFIFITKV